MCALVWTYLIASRYHSRDDLNTLKCSDSRCNSIAAACGYRIQGGEGRILCQGRRQVVDPESFCVDFDA
jgi:hypothetical protein